MKTPAAVILGFIGLNILTSSLHADVLALQFDAGKVTTAVDGFNGMAGSGWYNAWTGAGNIGTRTTAVINTTPLHTGWGNYFQMVSTSTGSSQSSYVQRGIVNNATSGIDLTSAYTVSFSTRIDAITGGGVYFFGDDSATATGIGSSNTWRVSATMGGQWTVGASTGAQTLSMSLITGVTYDISLSIDPVARTYTVTISDGTTSVTSSAIAFYTTNMSSTGGQYLYFGAQGLNSGQSVTLDLDNISVVSASSIPEPASMAMLMGLASMALLIASRRLSRGRV